MIRIACRAARSSVAAAALAGGWLIASASPAAAHNVSTGSMPAPAWLLAYVGAFAVMGTAVVLRSTWSSARFRRLDQVPDAQADEVDTALGHGHPRAALGGLVALVVLVLVVVAAIVGPDSAAANVTPVAVLVVWWVGLPMLALVFGDVMRAINPYVAAISLFDRTGAVDDRPSGPPWTGAAFLGAFGWFFLAYHRPGSPRSLAVFLIVYSVAALAGGVAWGRRWLATGEGFGALSAALSLFAIGRRGRVAPPGLAALMVVWLGGSAFDAFSSTEFWIDVLGSSTGWDRTLLNSLGLLWLTAVVAGAYLGVQWFAGRRTDGDPPTLLRIDGPALALVPVAAGWFLAHDLTLFLFEGQNFIALLSDPIGSGWDLFGTIHQTIDYGIVEAAWVPWTQIGLLAIGHVGAVIIAHDTAIASLGARRGIYTTWAFAAAAAASIAAAALVVLG